MFFSIFSVFLSFSFVCSFLSSFSSKKNSFQKMKDGSTCVLVVIQGTKCVCANVGDSRGVMITKCKVDLFFLPFLFLSNLLPSFLTTLFSSLPQRATQFLCHQIINPMSNQKKNESSSKEQKHRHHHNQHHLLLFLLLFFLSLSFPLTSTHQSSSLNQAWRNCCKWENSWRQTLRVSVIWGLGL